MDHSRKKESLPLVSVIMPAYNGQEYVEQAIRSVMDQTVQDWELLVIDDGSTDNTRAIVEGLSREDSRISLIRNEANMGVAKTRNRGLALSKGTYVALLDSDDYWAPEMLQKMIARAEETKADIVYCSYAIVDEQGQKLCNDFIVPPETTFEDSIIRNVISCSTALLASELAKNSRFPTNIYHEDTALWFQLLRDGMIARGVPEVLAFYRQRTDSRSSHKLVSAVRRWAIYRKHLKMPLIRSVSAMVRYAYYGSIKYKRIPK